ncbi:hypothetical protein A3A79_02330 [Candidatus Gottesmanbacteria bacterium RIFCSPLOWO2_01_FULL_43_11b]|uniref:Glycosyltransferase 2-like domain-containing protein n=1 Tax=Candidatus Gottesmanbacteria bacterium RIFCSPLOWO2_01_FULL_43_11b TaxID=1798392 RepID=A0A1F6AH52_9BACT|nr:MAG: hypothetical protein A3A79_02330 [Candidatus Gottesmanbacteria bacterium RIFCSPLOWO2_01_FULL_43_11b]
MTQPPTFSVIIPTLNEEKFLPNLLRSLADQSKKDFEVIVVDGSSKDKTVTLAKKFPGVKIIVSKKANLPLQRNLGAKEARGRWLVFVDADSILTPYFFERIVRFIEKKNPPLFTTWAQPDSDDLNDHLYTLLANLVLEGSILLKRPMAPGPLSVIHRQTFFSVRGYDEDQAYNEDIDLGLRLFKKGITLTILPESLYVWSMRRIRREGKMKIIQQYVVSALPILLFKRPLKYLPGYLMGGHLYGEKKPIKKSLIKTYEKKLKKLMKEIFE